MEIIGKYCRLDHMGSYANSIVCLTLRGSKKNKPGLLTLIECILVADKCKNLAWRQPVNPSGAIPITLVSLESSWDEVNLPASEKEYRNKANRFSFTLQRIAKFKI